MVIDVHQQPPLQPRQPRPGHAIALQQDHRVVVALHPLRLPDSPGARQTAINHGHRIRGKQISLLAHLRQHQAAGQHRSHRIAVWPRMRAHGKPLPAPDHLQHRAQIVRLPRGVLAVHVPAPRLRLQRNVLPCCHSPVRVLSLALALDV